MNRTALFNLILVVLLLAVVGGSIGAVRYYADLPNNLSQHETIIVGQNRYVPGSQAALRVEVRNSKDGAPLPDAQVVVELRPEQGSPVKLYEGRTGSKGAADVAFHVPDSVAFADGKGTLIVRTKSSLGADMVERPVTVEREYRVLLTTDKPIYQPGQVIHVRALALSAFDLHPAVGQPLEITIADGKGNKVFRQLLTTTDFGTAFTDFQLADEVNTGAYKISATLGGVTSEKTVTVEHYVLPKFEVDLQTEQSFYQPGAHVAGTLNARYFFGKPANEAVVKLEGFTFDVERTVVFTIEGQTDADGNYAFEFDLPAYLAGSDLDGGLARFYVQASITDQAQHTEMANLSLPVAGSAVMIEAVPESGTFRQGLENVLYVMTSTPDGSPVEADLAITLMNSGQIIPAHSGPYGLAEVRFVPDSPYQYIAIQARDAAGSVSQREFQFEGDWSEDSILLRPERPVYKVGETMNLAVHTVATHGAVYLDIVREGQTVSTRALDVSNGLATAAVDLTPDLYGTLELHAYKILPSGSIVRDTRLVVVSQANDLSVSLSAGQEIYRPGDTAQLSLQVNGQGGEGVQSAVGLAIVDESVFALAETDPGFVKLYFLLEQEILTPRYDLHGYSIPDLIHGLPEPDPLLRGAVDGAAQASLSDAIRQSRGMGASAFSLVANSHDEAMQRAYDRQEAFFETFSMTVFWAFLLIPLAIAGVTVAALLREKQLGRSLLTGWALIVTIALLFILIPSPEQYTYGDGVMDRIGGWIQWAAYGSEMFLPLTLLAMLVGLLLLFVAAARRKDLLLEWTAVLVVLFIVATVLVVALSVFMDMNGDLLPILVITAFLLPPVVLLVRLAGLLNQKRFVASAALVPVIFFLLVGTMGLAEEVSSMSPLRSVSNFGNRRLMGGDMVFEEAMAPMAAMPAAGLNIALQKGEGAADGAITTATESQQGSEPPRLRQYFPETMLWLPDAITDANGTLTLDIPVADSITTWRMTALASSQDGRLGSVDAPLRVFQDFFIDLDLPLSLTVGDEVAIPVGVFNYLPEEQTVRLELEPAPWFELQGEPVQEMTIAANDISVVYFRIRALNFGMQPFKVTALGTKMSDAILKEVRVYPDGKEIRFTQSDRLTVDAPIQQSVTLPVDAIPGTERLTVKIYPGILSQVVEGLDSILRMPFGCFEQTSSTTYPNVLVMDYLKSTKQVAPEAQMKAEEYINLGYQRLTTFEVNGGGFSLFGDAPADRMLTAYGLQEFTDMARVHDVDPALIERTANWLLSQQNGDGTWDNDQGLVHEDTWSSLGDDKLPVTAYIVWSLVEAGYADREQTQRGMQYVRDNQANADDPYALALVANALVAADVKNGGEIGATTTQVLDRLAGMAVREGQGAYWQSSVATFVGAEGLTGSIETTALAAYALLRSERHPEVANGALNYLIQQKDSFGTWHSTQATVLTLKAMLQSVRGSGENTSANVTITLNGGEAHTLAVTPENFDVVQMVSFDGMIPGGENVVEIRAEGRGTLMYQVAGSYYLPWDKLPMYADLLPAGDQVQIDVAYNRSELAVNDSVTVGVKVSLLEPGASSEQAIIDLGIPPGFSVQAEDLQALVAFYNDQPAGDFPSIERYELTGRQIIIYVRNLQEGVPLEFQYRLVARFPLNVQSPAGTAYDYYNPDVTGIIPPTRIVVNP